MNTINKACGTAETPNSEARSVTSHNAGQPPRAAVENEPNIDRASAASINSTRSMEAHRENHDADAHGGEGAQANITSSVEEAAFVRASAQNNNNQGPLSGTQVAPNFQTPNNGHHREEDNTHESLSEIEDQGSAGNTNEPQRRGSYRGGLKFHRDSTKTGSTRYIETHQKDLELKERSRSRTLITPDKTFEETNRVLIAAYKIAAGSAHLVPLYRHTSPWVPKGPWKPNGRRQASVWWRSRFRVAHKSFLRTFSTMAKEDLDALEQVLQDHGNDGSYPFLVDLKRMSGGWYFKSWTKNACPAYLAIVEEHYYVEENSETSVLRATIQQHQNGKSSSFQGRYLPPFSIIQNQQPSFICICDSDFKDKDHGYNQQTPPTGASQPKSHHLKPDLTRQRSSHSLIRNRARQSIMNARGIQDVSDMLTLDEDSDSSDEDSLSSREYRLFSIQPLAKDASNWVRCTVREEPLGTNEILQRIRDLDSDKTSVIDKKLLLRSDQQAQVTRVHDNVVTTESDPGMYWLLRQLQVMQKETPFFWKKGEDSGILVIFAREARPGFEHRQIYGSSTTTVAAANANENNLSKPMEQAAPLPSHAVPVPLTIPTKKARSPSIRSFEKKTELGKDNIPVIEVDVDPEGEAGSPDILDNSRSRRSRSRSKPSRSAKENTAREQQLSKVSTRHADDREYESLNMLSRPRSRVPSPSRSYGNDFSRVRYDAYSAGRKDQELEDEKREQLALERYYGQVDARHERANYWPPEIQRQSLNDSTSRRARETADGSQRQFLDNEVRNEVLVIRALEHRQGKAAEKLHRARTGSEAEEARLDLNMSKSFFFFFSFSLLLKKWKISFHPHPIHNSYPWATGPVRSVCLCLLCQYKGHGLFLI